MSVRIEKSNSSIQGWALVSSLLTSRITKNNNKFLSQISLFNNIQHKTKLHHHNTWDTRWLLLWINFEGFWAFLKLHPSSFFIYISMNSCWVLFVGSNLFCLCWLWYVKTLILCNLHHILIWHTNTQRSKNFFRWKYQFRYD